MKKLLLFIAFIIALGNTSFAQKHKKGTSEVDPPGPVAKAFGIKYKMAKKPYWSQEEENYKVEFKLNDFNMAVCYAEDGKMLYTEKELPKAQHNKTIMKYVLENYAGYKIIKMKKRDTYDKKTTYIAMLRKTKELLEVEFDKKGGFIRDTDRTPVTASKKKGKKDEDEETNDDEEKPVKKAKVKKGKKTNDEENDDEEATPAAKPEKAKPAPKKNDDNDEEEAKPAPKKETKAKPDTKKKTDEDDDEDVKTPPKKEKEKPAPKPKKEKKKKTDEDDDE